MLVEVSKQGSIVRRVPPHEKVLFNTVIPTVNFTIAVWITGNIALKNHPKRQHVITEMTSIA